MAFELTTERTESGARVRLAGEFDLNHGADLWRRLRQQDPGAAAAIVIDARDVRRMDGGSAALVRAAELEWRRAGADVTFDVGESPAARQLALYGCEGIECLKDAPTCAGVLNQIGAGVVTQVRNLSQILEFIGRMTSAIVGVIRQPRSLPWRTIPALAERAGADGVAIVVLVNFLVGFTIALSGATILARYGANIFVAELVGFSVLRELGPLMTAILVAGRSGAAYAAELGTMQVGEEVDALRTMSLSPIRYLVLPRLIALMLMVPLLTVIADLVGILGGFAVATTTLGLSATTFFMRLQESVGIGDFCYGLIKSVAFAVAVALVACMRGLGTRGGAAGVGVSTTSAVVVSLFLLVMINAGFAFLGGLIGW